MGKCKFNDNWRERFEWVKRVPNNNCEAYCTLCKRALKLGTLGVKALESHQKSDKHQASEKSKRESHAMTPFCSVASTEGGTSSSSNLSELMGSASTMKAEVIWVFNTVVKHQSYRSNDDVAELFELMFPDSKIAKTFSCGKDKTAYIARFGLAQFIKQDLVSKVSGPFVIMFDESLNRATKNKQLDLHIRYWDGEKVHSRYLGSQFMGHSTANDLLKEVKVSSVLLLLLYYIIFSHLSVQSYIPSVQYYWTSEY